jgi:hypothetical protein
VCLHLRYAGKEQRCSRKERGGGGGGGEHIVKSRALLDTGREVDGLKSWAEKQLQEVENEKAGEINWRETAINRRETASRVGNKQMKMPRFRSAPSTAQRVWRAFRTV